MNKRLFIVFLLGFSSGLPLALLGGTLQAWFAASGASVITTGMLSLIGFPYIYRFLWSPLLDRFSLFKLGKRRSWVLSMQVFLLIGFNILAWFSPTLSPGLMALIALSLAVCSATQDIAIDAHRTEYLKPEEHGLGASFAVCGYQVAVLLAGGLALVAAYHFGWAITYRLMGLLMGVGVFAIIWSPEPSCDAINQEAGFFTAYIAPAKALLLRPGISAMLFFILSYKLAEAFTTTHSGIIMPFLIQGMGFSLDVIGYVNKVMGVGAVLVGGLSAGLLLTRWSLYRALWVFGLFQALSHLLFVALAITGQNTALFATAVVFNNLAAGMGSTALVAFFMRWVDKRFTATQFSILVGVSALPRVFSGPIGAGLQHYIGWVGLYEIAFVFTLGFVPFLILMRRAGVFSGFERDEATQA
ncbi:MAG: MFS transporter [Gammaproteobacteria bacterium]|nr:MFS transporter [Gammaproteobacteria bacterium]MCH9715785.1 MFS transporter [Gammaproteobacteria bacterium]MCH9763789.1 MFS transporter [Gammaproteobacteria bacterium]